ncbi:hypothetical protein QNO07_16075 [Streptomyces sp. 549]|uniref:hypothetical protein n=1 Tax=Streptomyces sp. 549 TaxID=3049076 RepID=UPI0024C35139|nr:hypothetical protein [Streptomyces sp. 549]MDK1474921.1 hypothetical protein [Streptomyces sp. 549]
MSAALVGAAAVLAAGLTAVPAGAAAPEPPGAAPAVLSAAQYTGLVMAADTPAAKARTAAELGLGEREELQVRGVVKNRNGDTRTRYERTARC